MTNRTFDEIKANVDQTIASNDAEALLRYAVELDAIDTPQAEAVASRSRGWVHSLRGDYPAALSHLHRALALYEELGDRSGVASVTGNIGIVHASTGDNLAALSHYHRALAIHEELGNRSNVATGNDNIGSVHSSTGDYPEALSHYHRALALYEELGDRGGVANVTGNIGIVHASTGDYPEALSHFHRALALNEELGDRSGEAAVTGNIGNVHDETGDYKEALSHFHRALALHEDLGDRSSVALVTGNIGNVHGSTGDYPEALSHFHRALALFEELGERSGVARVTGNILAAYVVMGSDTKAQQLLETMDSLHSDEPRIRIQREKQRATLKERSGDLDGASVTLQHALSEALEHGLRSQAADVHKAMRDLALKQNNLAGYVEHNNEFTRITEEINGKDTATKLAMQAKQREIDAVQREHAQHMAVLHSTLPKHIADRVARGETVNDHYDNAAVIFLDIVGFTTISDSIPSGHVVHLLEQIFTTLDAVCDKHNVVKIKTIGDSYMAVAFPGNGEQGTGNGCAQRAAQAALEMMSSMNALQITMPPELGDTSWTKNIGDIKVRIGMHCGPVTAGVIGTARMQYDVWGDTVNVASRMESSSEPGRIHVSAALANALKTSPPGPLSSMRGGTDSPFPIHYSLFPRGEMEIKGKGTMTTYWLE